MTSSDSSQVISGKIDGKRLLSILLPEPGGPTSKILWLPAAATSIARFTFSCPRTSLKSKAWMSLRSGTQMGSSSNWVSPFSADASSLTVFTGMMAGPLARVASAAFSAGTYTVWNPAYFAAITIGSTPFTGRICPSRLNSPRNALEDLGLRMVPIADIMPNRIGRSKCVPLFFRLAGARLTVMRPEGNFIPLVLTAARTRSFASLTAASGRPTISKAGRPLEI